MPVHDDSAPHGEPTYIELDADIYEYVAKRAAQTGRTVGAQLLYELKARFGLIPLDPGDHDARMARQVLGRSVRKRPLFG